MNEIEQEFSSHQWWPTPILVVRHRHVEEFNKALARIVFQQEKGIREKGMPTAVAGLEEGLTAHWLEYNVLNWDFPECRRLRELVLKGVRQYFELIGDPDDPELKISGISCWANILRRGESLDIHHHDPGFISAHYTVQSGNVSGEEPESRDSGHTIYYRPGFVDRSHGSGSPWDFEWRVSNQPREGNLLFFPSYVRHEVRPNLGQEERISIAMDIYVEKQKAPIYFGGPRWYVPE